jgi:tetratricopeptide (TPR) repeat protein
MRASASVTRALAQAARLLDRAPHLAEQQAAAILRAVPGHPEAELLRGTAKRRQGDAAGAARILSSLAEAQPKSARTHYELALAEAALGENARSIAALRRTVALAPGMGEAWRTLGDVLRLTGDAAGADAAYGQQVRNAAHDKALMSAAEALGQGRLDVAERLLVARLSQHPTDVAAMRMLAEAATRLGRNADAEHLLRSCLDLAPSFPAARHNYATVLFRQGRAHEAVPHVETLLEYTPSDPGYRRMLAACLTVSGDHERAIDLYEDLLKGSQGEPKIWMSYGHALRTAGRRADAIAAYHRSIALSPTLGETWWSLANLKTVPFTPAEVTAMRGALARNDLPPEDRLHLCFALGRALEQAGDYAESFAHYAAGAKLRRGMVKYSAEETHASVERARAVFTPAFFAARAGHGCNDPAPIFVVGLPRSGSTLIEQILSSHSAVEGTMELPDIAVLARDIGRPEGGDIAAGGNDGPGRYPACLAELPAADIAALGARYIERTQRHRRLRRAYFIDKMPNNWIHTGLIHLILPNAKIIDARRHPMAACFSSFKQHFARGQHFSYDLTELGRYYTDYVAMMGHIDTVLPGRVHRVQYENMVTDTETQVRALLDYCGLPFEAGCLRFWETERAVRTASSEQVRQPIFREGMDHWRNYAPWLDDLREALGEESKAGASRECVLRTTPPPFFAGAKLF